MRLKRSEYEFQVTRDYTSDLSSSRQLMSTLTSLLSDGLDFIPQGVVVEDNLPPQEAHEHEGNNVYEKVKERDPEVVVQCVSLDRVVVAVCCHVVVFESAEGLAGSSAADHLAEPVLDPVRPDPLVGAIVEVNGRVRLYVSDYYGEELEEGHVT